MGCMERAVIIMSDLGNEIKPVSKVLKEGMGERKRVNKNNERYKTLAIQ